MSQEQAIIKNRTLLPSQDYNFLREEGIKHIRQLAGKLWTDYNTHDPGITLLELLSYAITDLGHRTAYDIKDIIAEDPSSPVPQSKRLHTALQILPCNPVSLRDMRKLMIDIEGVRDAQFEIASSMPSLLSNVHVNFSNSTLDLGPGQNAVRRRMERLNGYYNVHLELEDHLLARDNDTTSEKAAKAALRSAIYREAQGRLNKYRNLCEDFLKISADVETEKIEMTGRIEIDHGMDPNQVLAEIYFRVGSFISPNHRFYTLADMLAKGRRIDKIYEGPVLDHGFLDDEELDRAAKPASIHVSDLIQVIMDVKGVTGVPELKIRNRYKDASMVTQTGALEQWCLHLSGTPGRQIILADPELVTDTNTDIEPIRLYRGAGQIRDTELKQEETMSILHMLRANDLRQREATHSEDLPVPTGEYQELDVYSPVQNELPRVYGTGHAGLPESASAERKAQAKQLKAYLIFFEQVFANYLAQLEHTKELLSWNKEESDIASFTQDITGISNSSDLFLDVNEYRKLSKESDQAYYDRKNRLLDHLMARFHEQMTDYTLLLFAMKGFAGSTEVVNDKLNLLEDFPVISAERGKGFDYTARRLVDSQTSLMKTEPDVWDTNNVTGFEKRVSRLSGIDDYSRRFLYAGHRFFIRQKIGSAGNSLGYYFELEVPLNDGYAVLSSRNTTSNEFFSYEAARVGFDSLVTFIESRKASSTLATALIDGSDAGTFFFNIKNGATTLAASPRYTTSAERDAVKAETIAYLEEESYWENEGFHLLEHTLLYPRTETVDHHTDMLMSKGGHMVAFRGRVHYDGGTVVGYSPVTAECLLPVKVGDPGKNLYDHLQVTLPVNIDLVERTDLNVKIWEQKTGTRNLLFDSTNNQLGDIDDVIHALMQYGTSIKNYRFTVVSGSIRFSIVEPVQGRVLGTGVAETPEGQTPVQYNFATPEAATRVILKLVAFFSQEAGIAIDNSCKGEEDPYSFKATAVLPAWPSKFRNYNMRSHIEKVMRQEMPAHINLEYIWVSREQMKSFEICYKNWLLALADDNATCGKLECIVTHLKTLVDVFKPHYEVTEARNEDTYEEGSVLATVYDPEGSVVSAELINGSALQPWMEMDSYGTITVNDELTSSNLEGTHYVVPGNYSLYIRTWNDKGEATDHTITITILADMEAEYEVYPERKLPCYKVNDLLAAVKEQTGSSEVVDEAEIRWIKADSIPVETTSGSGTVTFDGITFYTRNSPNARAGDFRITNTQNLEAKTYDIFVLTTGEEGGRSAFRLNISLAAYNGPQVSVLSSRHEGQYINGIQLVTFIDDDISEVTTNINLAEYGLTKGPLQGTQKGYAITVSNSSVFRAKLATINPLNILTHSFYFFAITGIIKEECVETPYTVVVSFNPDKEAIYTLNQPLGKKVGEYIANAGTPLATITDPDGAINSVSFVQGYPLPPGTQHTLTNGVVRISINNAAQFRAWVGQADAAGLPAFKEGFIKVNTMDHLNGLSTVSVPYKIIPDKLAVYSPVGPPNSKSVYHYKTNDILATVADADGVKKVEEVTIHYNNPITGAPLIDIELLPLIGLALRTTNTGGQIGDIYVANAALFQAASTQNLAPGAIKDWTVKIRVEDNLGGVTVVTHIIRAKNDTPAQYTGILKSSNMIIADNYGSGRVLAQVSDADNINPALGFKVIELLDPQNFIEGANFDEATGEITVA